MRAAPFPASHPAYADLVFSGSSLAYIPSPAKGQLHIGPLDLHAYGLLIAAGVVAAVWFADRRWVQRGGAQGTMSYLALWGVPAGLIGARAYSVITSWQQDTGGHWYRMFEIWQGGLGIWGGIACGVAFGMIGARRRGIDWRLALDCATPAFALAQAIGRWGNYFNQELYGKASGLPWAVKIDHPNGSPVAGTFQPTFLYESLWDLACVGLLLLAERKLRIKKGYLFFVYAALYTLGRFWTEYLRIDHAHKFFGLRLNDWVSVGVFVLSIIILLTKGRRKDAGSGDEALVGEGAPAKPPESQTAEVD
jgi:prolipoprotein diacylglyceryl transferase